MRITEVTVRVGDAEADGAALAGLLEVPLEVDLAGPYLRIGWTVVRPVTSTGAGVDHLAFLVPGDAYPAARAWLLGRSAPLGAGVDVEGPPGWDSTSVYFDGPAGVVLELIAHDGHRADPAATFPAALLGVCEVGIAVEDVPLAIAAVGLPVFAGTGSPGFAAVGDLDGRLILVSPGRTWFPTEDRVAGLAPVVVTAEGAPAEEVALGGGTLLGG